MVIELATDLCIAGTASGIIFGALKVAEKVLQLRSMAADIRLKNLQAKLLEQPLKDAADKQKEQGIETIIEEQLKAIGLKKNSGGDKVVALEKSISKLVNFIEKGGEVDFVIPEENFDEEGDTIQDDYSQIRNQAEQIRQLESQLRLLEGQSNEEGS